MLEHNQLPLNIRLSDDACFSSFYTTDNHLQLMSSLQAFLKQEDALLFYLWGGSGVGKSHLLQACCVEKADSGPVSYVDLADKDELTLAVFEGLEQQSMVCFDNVDTLAGNQAWEEALFHAYNRIQQNKGLIIVSASASPRGVLFQLKDLQSRLSSGITYSIQELDDAEKISAIQLRASIRGLEISDEVGRYLLSRYPRNLRVLFELLEQLDELSLVAQRKLTIPFVKTVCDKSLQFDVVEISSR